MFVFRKTSYIMARNGFRKKELARKLWDERFMLDILQSLLYPNPFVTTVQCSIVHLSGVKNQEDFIVTDMK